MYVPSIGTNVSKVTGAFTASTANSLILLLILPDSFYRTLNLYERVTEDLLAERPCLLAWRQLLGEKADNLETKGRLNIYIYVEKTLLNGIPLSFFLLLLLRLARSISLYGGEKNWQARFDRRRPNQPIPSRLL